MNPPSLNNLYVGLIGVFNQYLLPTIGLISVFVFMAAGIMRMLAGANSQNVTKANTAMMWGIVGMLVSLGSILIIRVVFGGLLGL